MRLTFVHGINNEDQTVESIHTSWLEALKRGWDEAGLAVNEPDVVAAYYGKDLAKAAKGESGVVAMGDPVSDPGDARDFLEEYRIAAGVDETEFRQALRDEGLQPEVVEAGFPHNRYLIAAARALEKVIPTRGKYLTKFGLPQAAIYIGNEGVRRWIDSIVHKQLFKNGDEGETVLIAHSLGTLVSYNILVDPDNPAKARIPLFVTLGSPLTLASVKACIPARSEFPKPPIERWVNGVHTEDFVTLGRLLGVDHLGYEGIETTTEIVNDTDDKHSIEHYLSSPAIATEIAAAIRTG